MMDSKKKCKQCGGPMDRDGKRVMLCIAASRKINGNTKENETGVQIGLSLHLKGSRNHP